VIIFITGKLALIGLIAWQHFNDMHFYSRNVTVCIKKKISFSSKNLRIATIQKVTVICAKN
jgi:hypothetical protein